MGNIVNFVLAHKAPLGMVAVALLDFAFAMNPSLQANGLLHAVYVGLVGAEKPPVV